MRAALASARRRHLSDVALNFAANGAGFGSSCLHQLTNATGFFCHASHPWMQLSLLSVQPVVRVAAQRTNRRGRESDVVGATPNVIVPPPDHANTHYWGAIPRTHESLFVFHGPVGPKTLYPPVRRQPHIGNYRARSLACVSRPVNGLWCCAGLTSSTCGCTSLQYRGSFTATILFLSCYVDLVHSF